MNQEYFDDTQTWLTPPPWIKMIAQYSFTMSYISSMKHLNTRISRNFREDLILALLERLQLAKIVYRKQYIPLRNNVVYRIIIKNL